MLGAWLFVLYVCIAAAKKAYPAGALKTNRATHKTNTHMAKQKGLIKIQGEMGDITFYKTQDGFLAREKVTISRDRLKNDPAFERTRENNAEFTHAANAAKLLRMALREAILTAADSRSSSRLLRDMMRAVRADAVSDRGKRNVLNGNLELLQGFEFSLAGELTTTFKSPYVPAIDRTGGTLSVSVPSFIPARMLSIPEGATHFRFVVTGAEVDFEKGVYLANTTTSVELKIGNDPTTAQNLEVILTPGTRSPLFLAFGVDFCQGVNGKYYALKNGSFNSMALVQVKHSV